MHCRLIKREDNSPYLERYFINGSYYLHRFVARDVDYGVHDHPWRWAFSFIIIGAYLEKLRYGNAKFRRWFNYIGPNHFHQIVEAEPKTWTLFLTGKKVKEWGFLNNENYRIMKSQPGVKNYKDYPKGNVSGRAPL